MLIKHGLESPYFTCMKSIRTEVTGTHNPGEHFLYTRITAFSLTSLFFRTVFARISNIFPQTSQQNQNPWKWHFDLLVTFSFPLSHLIFIMRSWTERSFHFRGKKCVLWNVPKENRFVKTSWHRPSMGVARWGLWAPDATVITFKLPGLYTLYQWR